MDSPALARGYAEALLALARAGQATAAAEAELRVVGQLLKRHQGLRRALRDPGVSDEARAQLLRETLAGAVSPMVAEHLIMMIRQGHGHLIGAMIDGYLEASASATERLIAEVHSVIPLDESQVTRLEKALSRRFKRPVLVHGIVDPSVEGGLLIRIGNDLIDASLHTRLSHLRSAMRGQVGGLGPSHA